MGIDLDWSTILIGLSIIGIYVLYLFYISWKDSKELKEHQAKKKDKEDDVLVDFSLEELHDYDGIKNPKVYIGCRNKVFDVTNSYFYSPEGPYHAFAGNECSVAFAKFSEDSKYFNCYDEKMEFTLSEKDNLDSWFQRLYFKYKQIGKVVNKS